MILQLSANTWVKYIAAALGIAAVILLWSWAAGSLFMLVNHASPTDVLPHTFWKYVYYYHHEKKVAKQLLISGLIPFAAMVFAIGMLFKKTRSLHGDAQYASYRAIVLAGLLKGKGVIIGQRNGKFLMSDGPYHVLVAAPTRSFKGVSVVIPNLLNWPGSVVVKDIKQENWEITAGFRAKHGQQCFLFNPAAKDLRSHRWNPLAYVPRDEHFRVDGIQKIGSMLWPETTGAEGHWDSLANQLFLGIALYIMDTPELPFTIGECLRQSMKPDLQKRFLKLIKDRQDARNPLAPQCVFALNSYAGCPDRTAGSILSTFQSKLTIWLNPVVDAATSGNDFDLRDLRRKKMSIYLGITPNNLSRLSTVVNLFFAQVVDLQMDARPEQDRSLKHEVLLIMDEFIAAGKIPTIANGVAFIAGYGLRLMPIIQSPSQLVEVYGQHQAENFIENHAVRLIFTPATVKIAKEISESLGYSTVKGVNVSKEKGLSAKVGKRNESESDQRRALELPQELMRMSQKKEIIFHRDVSPIRANKIMYFKQKIFKERLLKAPVIPLLVLSNPIDTQDFIAEYPQETTRPIVESDLKNLNDLSLDSFSCDFSNIEIPTDPISNDDLEKLVNQFFSVVDKSAKEAA